MTVNQSYIDTNTYKFKRFIVKHSTFLNAVRFLTNQVLSIAENTYLYKRKKHVSRYVLLICNILIYVKPFVYKA